MSLTESAETLLSRENSNPNDELSTLRRCLKFVLVDFGGNCWASCLSWIIFGILAIVVPIATGVCKFCISLLTVEEVTLQVSLTLAGIPAFWSIRALLHRHGLSRSMFLTELLSESMKVQSLFVRNLHKKLRVFYVLITACIVMNFTYRVYWFYRILPPAVHYRTHWLDSGFWVTFCGADLLAFVYRHAIVYVSSMLLQIHCILQVLRMEDFKDDFSGEVLLRDIFDRHKSVETHLNAISDTHRFFVACLLATVTGTQLWCVVLVTWPGKKTGLPTSSEFILSTVCLVSSLIMCLRSAVRITEEAQSIKRHAVSWHARISMSKSENNNSQTTHCDSEVKDKSVVGSHNKEFEALAKKVDTTNNLLTERMHFENRKALLAYLEEYKGGISFYGFVLDRQWLQATFMMQLSLTTWVLSQVASFDHSK